MYRTPIDIAVIFYIYVDLNEPANVATFEC